MNFDALIQQAAEKHLPDHDWRLFRSQIFQESRFDPAAVSPAGAKGLAQIMDPTFEVWSAWAGYEGASPFDPEASLFTGAMYMANRIEKWYWPRPMLDRYCLALASYNAGFGHILHAQKLSPPDRQKLYIDVIAGLPLVTKARSKETIAYVRNILKHYSRSITG